MQNLITISFNGFMLGGHIAPQLSKILIKGQPFLMSSYMTKTHLQELIILYTNIISLGKTFNYDKPIQKSKFMVENQLVK